MGFFPNSLPRGQSLAYYPCIQTHCGLDLLSRLDKFWNKFELKLYIKISWWFLEEKTFFKVGCSYNTMLPESELLGKAFVCIVLADDVSNLIAKGRMYVQPMISRVPNF